MSHAELRTLPQSIDAEQALLGAMLINNAVVGEVRTLVAADDFYVPLHGQIWDTILAMVDRGAVVTPTTLKPFFATADDLPEAGDVEYFDRLAGSAVSIFNTPDYARQVRDLANRRQLIEVCERTAADAYDPAIDQPAEEIAATALAEWQAVADRGDAFRIRSYREVAIQAVENLKLPAVCYSTGLPALDRAMDGGIYPGKAYGFAGRKKHGKTVLAATFSAALNGAGVKHLFVAGEMGAEQIVQRQMAHALGAYPSVFTSRTARNDPDFQSRAAEHAVAAPMAALYADAPGLTFERLRQLTAAGLGAHRITGVIVDYLQLVGGQARGETQARHLDQVSQWVADTARKFNIWFVVMAQVNQTENIRGGEGMRLAFDQVFQIHRDPDGPDPDAAWLEMLETRHTRWKNVGSEDRPGLIFNARGPMFEPVPDAVSAASQMERSA